MYYRGGIYNIHVTAGIGVINPANSGTAGNPITFSAAPGETPIITSDYGGFGLSGVSYIRILGFTFQDDSFQFGQIDKGSHHNEIANNTFENSPGFTNTGTAGIFLGPNGGTVVTHNWIHNNTFSRFIGKPCNEGVDMIRIGNTWSGVASDDGDNYNTIENNTMAQVAHTMIDGYGMYNVIRNNFSHNEPWIDTCMDAWRQASSSDMLTIKNTGRLTIHVPTDADYNFGGPNQIAQEVTVYETSNPANYMTGTMVPGTGGYNWQAGVLVLNLAGSGGSGTYSDWTLSKGATFHALATAIGSNTIGTGAKTVTTQPGLNLGVAPMIAMIAASDPSNAMNGFVTSYDNATGALTLNITAANRVAGSGTFTTWVLSGGHYLFYGAGSPFNGKMGHRNFQMTDSYARPRVYQLMEGNRLGWGSVSPNNGGADNLSAGVPYGLVRYNTLYASMATNAGPKYASGSYNPCTGSPSGFPGKCGGDFTHFFNNTLFHSGYGYNWLVYASENNAYSAFGFLQDNGGVGDTAVVVKNNIVYDSFEGDICTGSLATSATCPAAYDTITHNWLTANGNPQFINTGMTDPTSATAPDLRLQPASPAINGGTYLTQAVGAGAGSTTLAVGDANYFQDGTWGSDLARGVTFFPDWIAIGTVTNTVQISSINYATNTITLASPATWSDKASIWLYKKSDGAVVLSGTAPDYGASEFVTGTRPLPPTNLQTTVR